MEKDKYRNYWINQIFEKSKRNILNKNKEKFLELKLLENNRLQTDKIKTNKRYNTDFLNTKESKETKLPRLRSNRIINSAEYNLNKNQLDDIKKQIKFWDWENNRLKKINKSKKKIKLHDRKPKFNINNESIIKERKNNSNTNNLFKYKDKITNKYISYINKNLDWNFKILKDEIDKDSDKLKTELNILKDKAEDLKIYKNYFNDEINLIQNDILHKNARDDEYIKQFYKCLELTNEDNYVTNNNLNKANNLYNNHYNFKLNKNFSKPFISNRTKKENYKYDIINIKNKQRNHYLNKIHNIDKLKPDYQNREINKFLEKESLNNLYFKNYN